MQGMPVASMVGDKGSFESRQVVEYGMAADLIEEALRITLADHQLSRGEKRALTKVVEDIAHDEQQLAHARHLAFAIAQEHRDRVDVEALLSWLEGVMKVLQWRPDPKVHVNSEAFFSPHDNCVGKIVRLFETSRQSVDVCVFTITDDRIKDAMLAAHRKGIRLRILSDNDKSHDLGSDVDALRRAGVHVRVDQTEYHMHHKFALFDQQRLLTGSYNWTRSAARNNEENFIVTGDPKLLRSFGQAFQQLWDELA